MISRQIEKPKIFVISLTGPTSSGMSELINEAIKTGTDKSLSFTKVREALRRDYEFPGFKWPHLVRLLHIK